MNLFSQLPEKFFHGLTSRNREVYVNCMERIYRMSGDAISYKMDASRVRDAIAVYLMETQTALVAEEEGETFDEPVLLRPAAIIAQLIRYGWLARELQEDQYGEDIYITKPAILMLRFVEYRRTAKSHRKDCYGSCTGYQRAGDGDQEETQGAGVYPGVSGELCRRQHQFSVGAREWQRYNTGRQDDRSAESSRNGYMSQQKR